MNSIRNLVASLRRDKRGMTTVEYVIALCLVGAVAVGLWKNFGDNVRARLYKANSVISGSTEESMNKAESLDL